MPTHRFASSARAGAIFTLFYFIFGLFVASLETLRAADSSDVLLDLLVRKGVVTDEEAKKAKAEAEALRAAALTNGVPEETQSKWKIGKAFKNVELYGDLRFRYEYRRAE